MNTSWMRRLPCDGGLLATTYMGVASAGSAGVAGIVFPIALVAVTQLSRLCTVAFQRLSELS